MNHPSPEVKSESGDESAESVETVGTTDKKAAMEQGTERQKTPLFRETAWS